MTCYYSQVRPVLPNFYKSGSDLSVPSVMLKGVCIKMQTIKKGIKRMAALAGSALMLGSTIAAPALSANLSDFPGMFINEAAR